MQPKTKGITAMLAASATVTMLLSQSAFAAPQPSVASYKIVQGDHMPAGINAAVRKHVTTNASSISMKNVVDGSASTAWYPSSNTGKSTVTVDLGSIKKVSGFGITWAGNTAGAKFSVKVSADGTHYKVLPGTPKGLQNISSLIQYVNANGHSGRVRFVRLTIQANPGQNIGVGEFRVFVPSNAQQSKLMLGDDTSTMAQEQAIGTTYSLNGKTEPMLNILKSGGTNYIRIRLWVNPPGGANDLKQDLQMAKQIKQAGLKILLDIHYSDFWADPGKQYIPAAWTGETTPQLVQTVHNYTKNVVQKFADQGTPVDMVAVGNEVTNGMLWPNGEIYKNNTQDWTDFADLLKAGVSGAKAGNPRNHDLKIMIHTDLGGNNPGAVYFYKHILAQGVKFDVIGLSYYPFWHGPVIDMEKNIDELATQFKKPIVLAETQYPWTTANGDSTPDFVNSNTRLPAGYPATPKGQASFVRDLVSDVTAVPQHLGAGVFYWEPAWLPGVGWEPGAGTSNDNLTLFNWQGQALPAVDSYQIGWRR